MPDVPAPATEAPEGPASIGGSAGVRWEPWPDLGVPPPPRPWVRVLDVGGVVVVALLGAVLRVVQRSGLWLDEALSANIAALPLGDLTEALRHDGHPPLYYVLLHLWQSLVGDGPTALRLLSGLIGLALLPLVWVAAGRLGGRRAAWAALLLVALNPFVIRYATETRMYELVMVLTLAGWLVADHALRRPDLPRLAGLAVLTGALLWTHYWGLWLLAASGLGLLVRAYLAHRGGERARARASLRVAGALVVGGLLFLPWVPNLLYQSAHTGTPWAKPALPTEVVAVSMVDLGGGAAGESVLLAIVLSMLLVLGLFGRPGAGTTIVLDLRTQPEARRIALVIVGTLAVASAVSFAAGAAFASRYFAVLAPLVLVLAALGVARVGSPVAFRVVLAVVLALGGAAGTRNALDRPRTQTVEVADAIEAAGPVTGPGAPLIVVCPDQLGPSLTRALPEGADVVAYPTLRPADLVDWVDYEDRLAAADPAAVADEILARAGSRDIWLVWSGSYRTHKGTCEQLGAELSRSRVGDPVVAADSTFYEQAHALHLTG